MSHAPEITDEVIAKSFDGTNFGRTDCYDDPLRVHKSQHKPAP